jgi:hypothetical protein
MNSRRDVMSRILTTGLVLSAFLACNIALAQSVTPAAKPPQKEPAKVAQATTGISTTITGTAGIAATESGVGGIGAGTALGISAAVVGLGAALQSNDSGKGGTTGTR